MRVQPNFEDEITLLTARRVVPLQKIDAKERHRRHWLLGGAFALAMMLGAASALLASYLKLRNAPTVQTEITEVENAEVPVAVIAEPVTTELPPTEVTEETGLSDELATSVTPKRSPVKQRAAENRDTNLVRPRIVQDGDDENELERIRQAVLIDAWEERRARRAARRERRNRLEHHDRDLSNLDEIFQGQRRRRP